MLSFFVSVCVIFSHETFLTVLLPCPAVLSSMTSARVPRSAFPIVFSALAYLSNIVQSRDNVFD
jgi:hypothetical protein